MNRRRVQIALALLAAMVVPIQALGGEEQAQLEVTASLDRCGVGGASIMCEIDASWTGVAEADSYTASVTLADGSVQDLGGVGSGPEGGSAALWVPFAGNGIYTVTITAWASEPDGTRKKLEEKDASAEKRDESPEKKDQPNDGGDSARDEEPKRDDAAKETGSGEKDSGTAPEQAPSANGDGGPDPGAEVEAEIAPSEPADQPPAEPKPQPAPEQSTAPKAAADPADPASPAP